MKDIVYDKKKNPLDGLLLKYVIVDFQEYCGPCWVPEHPKWVPIQPIELACPKHCCKLYFMPLSLAYVKQDILFKDKQ